MRPLLEYGAVCWDPYRKRLVSAFNRVQKRASIFANNKNYSGWETFAHRRLIARICALFKAYTRGWAWTELGDRLLKLCYLSRDDHNRKIRNWKQRTELLNAWQQPHNPSPHTRYITIYHHVASPQRTAYVNSVF